MPTVPRDAPLLTTGGSRLRRTRRGGRETFRAHPPGGGTTLPACPFCQLLLAQISTSLLIGESSSQISLSAGYAESRVGDWRGEGKGWEESDEEGPEGC